MPGDDSRAMVWTCYVVPLLCAGVVLADYYIDNADASVIYSMAPTQSNQAWETFSVDTQWLALSIFNSTGNYTIPLDPSNCYDQNYTFGECGTSDLCIIQIPFVGSGITMYVFNAGLTGIMASFSVDGGAAVSNATLSPPPPTYQVSNVPIYTVQGLPTGNHTMLMTVLDWEGSASSMKFDYAYINETFIASPNGAPSTPSPVPTSVMTQSQAPTSTEGRMSALNHTDTMVAVGSTIGGAIMIMIVASTVLYLCRHRSIELDLFASENHLTHSPSPLAPAVQFQEHGPAWVPRSLAEIAAPPYPSTEPIQSYRPMKIGKDSCDVVVILGPPRQRPSHDMVEPSYMCAGHGGLGADSRPNLTASQLDLVDQLQANKVPAETVARVVKEFAESSTGHLYHPANDSIGGVGVSREEAIFPRPPSYQTEYHS